MHVFIINSKAGKKNFNLISEVINEYCITVGVNYSIRCVYDKEDTCKIIDEYKLRDDVVVYSVGGDGTLNQIINCIANTKLRLNVVPAGTGNDFYKSLIDFKNNKIDLGKVNDKYFINVASFGIDAEIANTANILKEKNIKSDLVYPIGIFSNFFTYNALNININNLNKLITILTICNGRFYGGKFNIAPEASLDDGMFDVCEVQKINKLNNLKLILKLIKAKHITDNNLSFYRTDSIKVESNNDLICNLDGEIIKGKNFDFSIQKDAIIIDNDELKIKELLRDKRIIK